MQNGETAKASSLVWEPTLRKFPHPALDSTSVVGFVIGPFIFAACMFSFVTQVRQSHRLPRQPCICSEHSSTHGFWLWLPPAAAAGDVLTSTACSQQW